MTFDLPILPVRVTLGRDKQELAPPQAANLLMLDGKNVAIVCLGTALLFTTLAVVALATER
jgi:hypothetical protein